MTRFVFWETPPEALTAAAPLYADLAALQMRLALVKLALKYNPSQPRVRQVIPMVASGRMRAVAAGCAWRQTTVEKARLRRMPKSQVSLSQLKRMLPCRTANGCPIHIRKQAISFHL